MGVCPMLPCFFVSAGSAVEIQDKEAFPLKIIEYFPGDSILHRLDPRTKLLALALITCTVYATTNFILLLVIFCFSIALWGVSGLPIKALRGYFKFLLGMLGFIVAVQMLFGNGTTYLLRPIIPAGVPLIGGAGSVKLEGLLNGLLLSFRLITLVTLMPLVTMTTPVHILSLGLMKIGVSYKVAYMATTAINLIPTFQTETQVIMDAQKMRGLTAFENGTMVQKFKAYPALVVPLVIGAMRRAQLMGVAMDSRAFGAYQTRTSVADINLSPADYAVMVLCVVFSAGVILLDRLIL
ncbi:Energy-coupling factor transporter transmembrane protein EcfT [bioreactor metagenome]|uniref:Energy-coupling factor transporter transmembrane protein EcfT n=1 Tax=bioreactor metagenome TaxID=1076179 RepID=A0A645CU33_9ZZZZ